VQAAAAAELLQELRAAQDARAAQRPPSAAQATSGQPQPDDAAPAAAAAAEAEQHDCDVAGARDAATATYADHALETLPEQVAALGARVDALGEAQDAAARAAAAQHPQVRAWAARACTGEASRRMRTLPLSLLAVPGPHSGASSRRPVARLAVPCDACAQADTLGEAAATVARVLERLAEHDAALAALGAGAAGARAASAQHEAALGGAREQLADQGAALRELRDQARTAAPVPSRLAPA